LVEQLLGENVNRTCRASKDIRNYHSSVFSRPVHDHTTVAGVGNFSNHPAVCVKLLLGSQGLSRDDFGAWI
jgi:hypothetical protein